MGKRQGRPAKTACRNFEVITPEILPGQKMLSNSMPRLSSLENLARGN
jgi:hypothetical protein